MPRTNPASKKNPVNSQGPYYTTLQQRSCQEQGCKNNKQTNKQTALPPQAANGEGGDQECWTPRIGVHKVGEAGPFSAAVQHKPKAPGINPKLTKRSFTAGPDGRPSRNLSQPCRLNLWSRQVSFSGVYIECWHTAVLHGIVSTLVWVYVYMYIDRLIDRYARRHRYRLYRCMSAAMYESRASP